MEASDKLTSEIINKLIVDVVGELLPVNLDYNHKTYSRNGAPRQCSKYITCIFTTK